MPVWKLCRRVSPFAWGLIALSPLLFCGCRRASSAALEAAGEQRLFAGNGVEPSTLDPHLNTGSPEASIISALWEPLIQWNETATEVVPAAAERWEISADGLLYTFHLRPKSRWSNGDPVTARPRLYATARRAIPHCESRRASGRTI